MNVRTTREPTRAPADSRQISIVFPAYNEARNLRATLEGTIELCERHFERWEIIVVDDGSDDGTGEIAGSYPQVRCLQNEVNRGKGQSVRRGMLAAQYDPVLFSDADLSTPIEEALSLLSALEDGTDIAIASRRVGGAKTVKRTFIRRFLAWGWRWFVRFTILKGVHDTQCGFKMFRREVARELFPLQRLDGWAFDVEILYLAQSRGYRTTEVLVEWHEREDSRLGFLSPFRMAADILRIRRLHREDRRVLEARARETSAARVDGAPPPS